MPYIASMGRQFWDLNMKIFFHASSPCTASPTDSTEIIRVKMDKSQEKWFTGSGPKETSTSCLSHSSLRTEIKRMSLSVSYIWMQESTMSVSCNDYLPKIKRKLKLKSLTEIGTKWLTVCEIKSFTVMFLSCWVLEHDKKIQTHTLLLWIFFQY